jgi:hypothetical protein
MADRYSSDRWIGWIRPKPSLPWRPVCTAIYESRCNLKLRELSERYELVYGCKPEMMALLKTDRPAPGEFTEECEEVF